MTIYRDIDRRAPNPDINGAEVELHDYDGTAKLGVNLPIGVARQMAEEAVRRGGTVEFVVLWQGREVIAEAYAARVDDYATPRRPGDAPVHDEPAFPSFTSMRLVP